MSLKSFIAAQVHQLAFATGFSVSRAKGLKAGRIIMFHGVGDEAYSAQEFESHLKFLASHFSVVSLEALTEIVRSGRQLTNQIALTFDDGLRNNFTVAYPVLERLSLPATFFVCPGLIDRGQWLWNHEARARLHSLELEEQQRLITSLGLRNGGNVEEVINWMKGLSLKDREAAETRIRAATAAFQPSLEQRTRCDMMTWEELQAINPQLITIGSHTVNHPILSTLGADAIHCEIAESRRLLEKKLGRKVEQFCYPNGAHNPEVVAEVRKHYQLAVTTEAGFVRSGADLLQLPRLGIVSQPLLSWRLHRPSA